VGVGIEKSNAQWSDKEGSVELIDMIEVEQERVMRRSRVWPLEWVGKVIC
jgi:hypothetical protein